MHTNLIILAGGASSRMKQSNAVGLSAEEIQQSNQRTKGLISIDGSGRPLLDYLLYNAKQAGYRHIYLVIGQDKIGHDLAYPAMLTMLPSGLLGLVLASLIAAFMSTISTQLNWGSSYIVHDFYRLQIDPEASEQKLVLVGRISTVVLMILSALLALVLQNALQLFQAILVFGAGTGLIFILRWYWWRINAWSEIVAMFVSGIISLLIALTPLGGYLFAPETGLLPDYLEFPFVVLVTTIAWVLATYMTAPEEDQVLKDFYQKVQPGGPGWRKVVNTLGVDQDSDEQGWSVPSGIIAMLLGCVMIYSSMFAIGHWIYGLPVSAGVLTAVAVVSGVVLVGRSRSLP